MLDGVWSRVSGCTRVGPENVCQRGEGGEGGYCPFCKSMNIPPNGDRPWHASCKVPYRHSDRSSLPWID